jgi:predicted small integral membrane protein
MLRIMKILLAASVALWGLLGAVGNLMNWSATTGAVAAVTSMSTFPGGPERWQATTNPAVILAGALFILLAKIATGLLCAAGSWRMWTVRNQDAATFAHAKTLVLSGCVIAILMLFIGFAIIGEGWFEFWRSEELRETAGAPAFHYSAMIALIALLITARND